MSWSLGETGALALKATRGAGFSWGIAEEAATAVIWLHEHGFAGAAALCSYLSWHSRQAKPAPSAFSKNQDQYAASGGSVLHREAEAACPLMTGSVISDGIAPLPDQMDKVVELGQVRMPLLLLPFVATLQPAPPATQGHFILQAGTSAEKSLDKDLSQTTPFDPGGISSLSAAAFCQIRLAKTPHHVIGKSARPRLENPPRLEDHFACCVEQLTQFAHHTYAPASSASRLAGAGAGLNDND